MKNVCRCGHYNSMHMSWFDNSDPLQITCIGYKKDTRCLCKDYTPSDNLEYLEKLYDKKKVQHG